MSHSLSNARWVALSIILLVGMLGILIPACSPQSDEEHPAVKLRIAVAREPLGSLLVLAAGQGFLDDEGVTATIEDKYPSGKRALLALLDGDVDLAPCAEAPIVFQSFDHKSLRIVATIGTSDNEPKIIARRDSGIEEPEDLRDKRVATQKASAVHYFLHLFLLRHGMSEADVELSFLPAEELTAALAEGTIDAISMRDPFVSEAQQRLGDTAIVFAQPGLYVKCFNLVAAETIAESNPRAIQSVLRALVRAEEFARKDPDAAINAIAGRLAIEKSALAEVWPEMDLRVSLGQGLLSALEDEARWATRSGFVEAKEVPNFLDFIDPEPLKKERPAAVTLVH